ncbi:SagB/ThcOx family dehydrogenase [candidate division KSB1 bacterium]|nr:SagB/ThcOx family dehydrogenase [candidate division KSB1 bacterium]
MHVPLQFIEHIGEFFQEYTRYKYFTRRSAMVSGVPAPSVQKDPPANARLIDLPRFDYEANDLRTPLPRIIESRASRRDYSNGVFSQHELSFLLWATQGVKKSTAGYTLRTVPSAGARHPLETYLAINRVENLLPGLFHYLPISHKIYQIKEDSSFSHKLALACLEQEIFRTCAVAFIWTAVIERSRWKYQQRAFRYIYLDAGHVCQNLYLACETLGAGCCAVAAFDDDAVNQLLDLDVNEAFVIYLATVGKL